MKESSVRVEELSTSGDLRIGVATLNAEKSLNALNLAMIRLFHAQLLQWAADPDIAGVVLRGAGEMAFCAGGMYGRCGRVCWPIPMCFLTQTRRLSSARSISSTC